VRRAPVVDLDGAVRLSPGLLVVPRLAAEMERLRRARKLSLKDMGGRPAKTESLPVCVDADLLIAGLLFTPLFDGTDLDIQGCRAQSPMHRTRGVVGNRREHSTLSPDGRTQ
jgi:hypothetical protein